MGACKQSSQIAGELEPKREKKETIPNWPPLPAGLFMSKLIATCCGPSWSPFAAISVALGCAQFAISKQTAARSSGNGRAEDTRPFVPLGPLQTVLRLCFPPICVQKPGTHEGTAVELVSTVGQVSAADRKEEAHQTEAILSNFPLKLFPLFPPRSLGTNCPAQVSALAQHRQRDGPQ